MNKISDKKIQYQTFTSFKPPKMAVKAPQSFSGQSIYNQPGLSLKVGLAFKGIALTSIKTDTDYRTELEKIRQEISDGKYTDRCLGRSSSYHIGQGKPREEIPLIVEAFRKLIEAKSLAGDKYRFNGMHITTILNYLSKSNFDYLNQIIDAQYKSKPAYRFDSSDVSEIMQRVNSTTERYLQYLLSSTGPDGEYRFNSKEFAPLLTNLTRIGSVDDIFVKSIIDYPEINQTGYRFNQSELNAILSSADRQKVKSLAILLNEKTKDGKHFRFNSTEIKDLLQYTNDNDLDYLKSVLFSRISNDGEFRFANNEIKQLLVTQCNSKDKETYRKYYEILLSPRCLYDYITSWNGLDIANISGQISLDNNFIADLLLASTSKDNKRFRFNNSECIAKIISTVKNNEKSFLQKILSLKTENSGDYSVNETTLAGYMPAYKYNIPHIKILAGLSTDSLDQYEKWALLKFLRSPDYDTFRAFDKSKISLPLLSYNADDMQKLQTKLLGELHSSETVEVLSQAQIAAVETAIKKIDEPLLKLDIEKLSNTAPYSMPLKYTRENFTTDVLAKTAKLKSKNDREIAQKFYNFYITEERMGSFPTLKELPDIDEALRLADDKETTRRVIIELRPLVQKYVEQNKVVLPDNPQLATELNSIIEPFPEFLSTIGKRQHKGHHYSLDLHLLKTLQQFIADPDYQKLPEEDKRIAKLAILFHDIAKTENAVDTNHAENSAQQVYEMMKRMKLSDRELDRIYGIIANHHWVQRLENASKKGFEEREKMIRQFAFNFRKPGDLEIAKIMNQADLKGVGDDFYNKLKNNYLKYIKEIEAYVEVIRQNNIYLPQTKIPSVSELRKTVPTTNISAEGVTTTNIVLDIKNQKDYSTLGLSVGTNRNNFYALIHAINPQYTGTINDIQFASREGDNGVLSASYITPDKNFTFVDRKFGFILEVDPNNIAAMSKENLRSGNKKGLESIMDYVLGDRGKLSTSRTQFATKLKEKLANNPEYRDVDYKQLFREKMLPNASITDFSTEDKALSHCISTTLSETILANENSHNEVVTYAPLPMAIFSKEPAEKIPYSLRLFAQERDLPIVII